MVKRKPIPKKTRQLLYDKYNHKCAYCGCDIEYKEMQVDHIKSIYSNVDYKPIMTIDEINSIDNLLPACRQCNFYKSTETLEMFRKSITDTLMKNLQKTFQYRLALKYGLIIENIKPIKFYFEHLENELESGINESNINEHTS
jgi:5-methylcytosine-specific restriction endonuclease McrA